MKKTLLLGISAVLAAIVLLLAFGKVKQNMAEGDRVWQHLSGAAEPEAAPASVSSDGTVDAGFSSHLPILLIDTDGHAISDLRHDEADSEASRYGDNLNPYTEMTLCVYDEAGGNSIASEPSRTLSGKIKVRGGSTADGKKQYRLKLLDPYGDGVKSPLLGMTADDEWILNGMDSDITSLRSYLAYNLAGELSLDSPDVRFCELVLKDGEEYRYLGLYLLTEPVERGQGRVALKGKKNLVGAYSYIVKRDPADSGSVVLSTWASQQAGLTGFIGDTSASGSVLSLVYPKNEKVTTDAISYITDDLSGIEQVLASDDISTFASFSGMVNTDSFIDYLILNEFLLNRGAGTTSTYMYRDIGGKLTIGPVWGFNGAASHPEDLELLQMAEAPLYEDLLKNSTFQRRLQARYRRLREDTLSDERIRTLLQEAEAYLGSALDRDRNLRGVSAEEYDSALKALSGLITQRGDWLDGHLEDLETRIVKDPSVSFRRAAVTVLAGGFLVCVFALAVRLKTGRSLFRRRSEHS